MVADAPKPRWLGAPEGARLEYKEARALRHPETIVRSVVAMLNGEGGTVVVGIDDDGRVVGVDEPARQFDRLQSILLDRIDPPAGALLTVRQVLVHGAGVLEVHVRKGSEGPYAERRRGMLGFWVRRGAVVRPLSVGDVRVRFDAERGKEPPEPRCGPLPPDAPRPALVLVARPHHGLDLKRKDRLGVYEELRARARELGIRPFGFTVLPPPDLPLDPRHERDALEIGQRGVYKWLRVERSGCAVFEGYEPFLAQERLRTPDVPVLNTYPLVEGSVTFVKLLAVVGGRHRPSGQVLLCLELWGKAGWKFRPHRPEALAWHDAALLGRERDVDATTLLCRHQTDWGQVVGAPERVAYRLVAELWEETFGLDESLIPFWDEATGQFRFD